MDQRSINIDSAARIAQSDKVGFHMRWPRAVSERLEQLTERAHLVRADRGEVAAAVLCSRDWTAEELQAAVMHYRGLQARDVVLDVPEDAVVIPLRRPGPGRRAKAG